ncbi:MAG: HAD-IA family hydrolase [Dehalococcoidia bacterium]|nr:HAD-IA family hydrolase [Dehalococcoidia bacterium]
MKALLWDMDDTLLDTLPARMRALAHAYEVCLGGTVDPHALWRSHRGGSLEAMGQRLLGEHGTRFVKAYRDFYYGLSKRAVPFEGTQEVLRACHEAGIPMAVVTSKVSYGAIDELAETDLLQYFAAVVGADDSDHHKPDPQPIYIALERICVDEPARTVFVGDSPADMFAARNAGCTSVAALWGALDEELTLDAAPGHTARKPAEVLRVVEARLAGVSP